MGAAGGNDRILQKIRQSFARHRQGRGRRGKSVPRSLRNKTLEAVRQGHHPVAVAKAAGISSQSIWNWGQVKKPDRTVRELKVVSESLLAPKPTAVGAGIARINFRSGNSIELPASALTTSLIEALSGGAS